ncbi:MAG: ABC transporter permease [Bacillota bacterium]|nr:ABC transporter permease [Bacillota bacterium]
MKTFEYTAMALKQIKINSMRSILTMLGIVIGIAAMIAVISVGDGGRQRVDKELQKFGINRLWIFPAEKSDDRSRMTVEDAEYLTRAVKEAKNLSPVAYRQNEIAYGGRKGITKIVGTNQYYFKLESTTLKSGRLLQEADLKYSRKVIILAEKTADALFGGTDPVMKKVMLQNQQFTVIGVESSSELSIYDRSMESKCYIPITAFEDVFGTNNVDELTMGADNIANTDTVGIKVVSALEDRYGQSMKYTMLNLGKEIKMAQDIMDTFKMVVSGIAMISLLVGGIGIMNIMLVTVKERTREIGIRKALGATNMQVLRQFLAEALMYSIIGGTLGIGLGIALTCACADIISVPVVISPSTLMACTGFTVAVGLFFGIYPAMKAARLDPVEALRIE